MCVLIGACVTHDVYTCTMSHVCGPLIAIIQVVHAEDFLGLTTPPHSPPDSGLCQKVAPSSAPTQTVVPCSQASSWTVPLQLSSQDLQHPSSVPSVTECCTHSYTSVVSEEATETSHAVIEHCAQDEHSVGGHTSNLARTAGTGSTVGTRGLC